MRKIRRGTPLSQRGKRRFRDPFKRKPGKRESQYILCGQLMGKIEMINTKEQLQNMCERIILAIRTEEILKKHYEELKLLLDKKAEEINFSISWQ